MLPRVRALVKSAGTSLTNTEKPFHEHEVWSAMILSVSCVTSIELQVCSNFTCSRWTKFWLTHEQNHPRLLLSDSTERDHYIFQCSNCVGTLGGGSSTDPGTAQQPNDMREWSGWFCLTHGNIVCLLNWKFIFWDLCLFWQVIKIRFVYTKHAHFSWLLASCIHAVKDSEWWW